MMTHFTSQNWDIIRNQEKIDSIFGHVWIWICRYSLCFPLPSTISHYSLAFLGHICLFALDIYLQSNSSFVYILQNVTFWKQMGWYLKKVDKNVKLSLNTLVFLNIRLLDSSLFLFFRSLLYHTHVRASDKVSSLVLFSTFSTQDCLRSLIVPLTDEIYSFSIKSFFGFKKIDRQDVLLYFMRLIFRDLYVYI